MVELPLPLWAENGYLASLTHSLNLSIRIEHALSYLTSIQQEYFEKGFSGDMHVTYGNVMESIVNISKRESASIIALTCPTRNGLRKLFKGNLAKELLFGVDIPLLLIRT